MTTSHTGHILPYDNTSLCFSLRILFCEARAFLPFKRQATQAMLEGTYIAVLDVNTHKQAVLRLLRHLVYPNPHPLPPANPLVTLCHTQGRSGYCGYSQTRCRRPSHSTYKACLLVLARNIYIQGSFPAYMLVCSFLYLPHRFFSYSLQHITVSVVFVYCVPVILCERKRQARNGSSAVSAFDALGKKYLAVSLVHHLFP